VTPPTGRVVETMDEAMLAMEGLLAMDRLAIRRGFEARFTASRMAHDYVSLYESIVTARETSALKSEAELSLPQFQVEEQLIL
jgi:hypothetical protein